VHSSSDDCTFSHYITAKHAHTNKYENILILEDDFIFEEDIYDKDNIDYIETFILSKLEGNNIKRYFLGCAPIILLPASLDCYHYKLLYGGAAQAVIHTKLSINTFINDYEINPKNIKGPDLYFVNNGDTYTYYKPLITQLFPETENRLTTWGKSDSLFSWLSNFGINILKLDKESNGFGIYLLYFLSKYMIFIICLIVYLIIYFIYKNNFRNLKD
jgi:hypothetical protein